MANFSENFLKSTGFLGNPQPATPTGMTPQVPSALPLEQFHSASGPNPPQHFPGMVAGGGPRAAPGPIPGRMPLGESMDKTAKNVPYPASDRIDKPLFAHRESQQDDWRAVGVGKETDRRSPGQVAQSPPQQGHLARFREKFAGIGAHGKSYSTPAVAIAAMGVAAAVMYMKYPAQRWLGLLAFAAFATAGGLYYAETTKGGEKAVGKRGADIVDTNKRHHYAPLAASQHEHNPYPKYRDGMDSMETRMRAQGTDMNNIEGPRDGYRYKRGPTPANQRRLQTGELMRDPSMHNMDKQEFAEYMARLEGESPDRFHQAHAYHPFGAQSPDRTQVDDTETVHGISTQPGQMLRKSKYIDPRLQQAGAKTSHLKDPPPGSVEPLDKVHPWTERQAGEPVGESFDMDNYQQQTSGGPAGGVPLDAKLGAGDTTRIADERMRETKFFMGPPREKEEGHQALPDNLEPVPTSRAGMLALEKRKRERTDKKMQHQNEEIQQLSQGYAAQPGVAHPTQSAIAQPSVYEGLKGQNPAQDDLTSAFGVKNQPSEEAVTAAINDLRR